MSAKINHLRIVSENPDIVGRFYEGFFRMRRFGVRGPFDPIGLGDGRIGLNIYPRQAGQPAQFDRFGIEVEDVGETLGRIRASYPRIGWSDPVGGAAAGSVICHDPDGNLFLLSQRGARDHEDIYAAEGARDARRIDHVALRVLHPQKVAEFYAAVFGFERIEGPGEANVYLSDGEVTLVVIPWRFSDFEQTGISARGMDHIGFRVESIAALKDDIARATERNFRLQPNASIVGKGKEAAGRIEMYKKTCPLGCHHLADPDGLILDVLE